MKKQNTAVNVINAILAAFLSTLLVVVCVVIPVFKSLTSITTPKKLVTLVQEIDYKELVTENEGVIIIAAGLPLSRLMRNSPEEYGLLPDGMTPEEKARDDAERRSRAGGVEADSDFTARQAVRTRAFWFIGFGHASAVLVVSAVMVHLVAHLNEGMGYSLGQASAIVAIMTAITAGAQLLGGILGDRFNKRMIATIAMFGHAGGLLALAWGGTIFWVIVFALMHGIGWGMRGPLMQAIRADYFGRASFAQIMGLSSMITMFGMMSGPIIAGLMRDRFGNYEYGFTVLAIMAALGSVFFIFATKPVKPGQQAAS